MNARRLLLHLFRALRMPNTPLDLKSRRLQQEFVVTQSNEPKASNAADPLLEAASIVQRAPLDETTFRRMIAIERKRTERSKAPFVLMLLEAAGDRGPKKNSVTR